MQNASIFFDLFAQFAKVVHETLSETPKLEQIRYS
jgi:hypothetical protein